MSVLDQLEELQLTDQERLFVKARVKGMSSTAAARAAGFTKHVRRHAMRLASRANVQAALEILRRNDLNEIIFTRDEAHNMLMEAYRNAETSTEQVNAVRALVQLHGISAPAKIEHKHQHAHAHSHEIREMSDAELLKLAQQGGDEVLTAEYYEISPEPLAIEGPDGDGEENAQQA